jgi:hypothetical protein
MAQRFFSPHNSQVTQLTIEFRVATK